MEIKVLQDIIKHMQYLLRPTYNRKAHVSRRRLRILVQPNQGHLYVPVRPRPANKLCPLNFSIYQYMHKFVFEKPKYNAACTFAVVIIDWSHLNVIKQLRVQCNVMFSVTKKRLGYIKLKNNMVNWYKLVIELNDTDITSMDTVHNVSL